MKDLMTPIVLPILTGLVSLIFILVLTPFAGRFRLLDQPNHRKHHRKAVPMVGGIAIYVAVLSAMLVVGAPDKVSWLMLSVSILVVVGVLDDALGLGVRVRFASQVLAASVMIMSGSFWIRSLGIDLWDLEIVFGWLGIPITIFSVVGLTNGFNMVDGIDGLASGHMLIGLTSVCLTLYATHGQVYQLEWLVILMSSVFAFFLVNLSLTPFNRVFLGDAGSLLLGFIMAWTLIYYTQEPIALMHPVAALWCVTIPVFDTLVVIARRIKNKQSPFSPDRNHFHHLLVDMGMKSEVALVIILGLSIVVNAFGILIIYAISPLASLVTYGLLLICFGYGMLHPAIQRQLALKLRLLV